MDLPERSLSRNNISALENFDFVPESIKKIFEDGSVKEVKAIPHVVNLLSVTINTSGKKRVILDLRYRNAHLFKERISFDDWKASKNFIPENSYAYKFDLKKGYHHVEILKEHQTLLGFSWGSGKLKRYFITVLPFGLSSAP